MTSRACRTCAQELPLAKFKLTNPRTGNRRPDCYSCVYEKTKTDVLERSKRYRIENAERIREQGYVRRYGVTIEWYESTLAGQGGGCAICGSDTPRRANVGYFAIDHDHITGKPRGLLCSPCNVGLGMLGSTDTLVAAINYLEGAAA